MVGFGVNSNGRNIYFMGRMYYVQGNFVMIGNQDFLYGFIFWVFRVVCIQIICLVDEVIKVIFYFDFRLSLGGKNGLVFLFFLIILCMMVELICENFGWLIRKIVLILCLMILLSCEIVFL